VLDVFFYLPAWSIQLCLSIREELSLVLFLFLIQRYWGVIGKHAIPLHILNFAYISCSMEFLLPPYFFFLMGIPPGLWVKVAFLC
jgi:hypothetical protein